MVDQINNNSLFLRITIETEQHQEGEKLSQHKYVEEVEYPALPNATANTITMGLRDAVQDGIGDYVKKLGDEKAKRTVVEDTSGSRMPGIIR